MTILLSDRITLTDEHSASSYGQPVAIIDGKPYGPHDQVPGDGHAWSLVFREAVTARLLGHLTAADVESVSVFWHGAGF